MSKIKEYYSKFCKACAYVFAVLVCFLMMVVPLTAIVGLMTLLSKMVGGLINV